MLDSTCGGGTCTGHTVNGNTTTYKIIVESGTHNVILDSAEIDVSATESACSFEITNGATVNLMLTGTNTLKSGKRCAGLEVSTGNTLTITEASTGSLGATGGLYGAGIGGGYDAGGTININGGIVTATGSQWGADIGGGSNGAGGIIFEGTAGSLYAANVTPSDSFTVPTAYTLTIEVGKTLTVSSGKTLTNNGTINNLGTVQNDGTLINKGTLSGKGSLTGDGVVQTTLTESMISLNQDSYVYTGSAFEPTVTVASTPWTGAAPFVLGTDYTVGYSENTAAGTATVTVTPQGSKLTGSAVNKTFTITTANSALELSTNKPNNTVTYGDTITFTATVSVAPAKGRSAEVNTVDFYYGSTKLNASTIPLTESGGTGTATFTYDTRDKVIPARTQTITAKYGGSGNLEGTEQSVDITLYPKKLPTGTIAAGQSKPYDGNNRFSGIAATFAEVNGVLDGDAVNAIVNGTTSLSEAGTSLPLTVTRATLGGTDENFYLLSTDPTTITGNVAITKAPLNCEVLS